jgi:hypothetical protein
MSGGASWQAENALLIAAARADGPFPNAATVDGLDWNYVLAAANEQGITPLLAHWLGQKDSPAPTHVMDRLHAAYWTNHFRNRTLLDQLHQLLAATAAEGIPIMPLKGAALVTWYYTTPALRPMSDLDFLVHPADTGRLADLLRACGFVPVSKPASLLDEQGEAAQFREHGFVTHADGANILIEYRTEALDPAVGPLLLANREMAAAYRDHNMHMWQRSQTVSLGDNLCTHISPEDLLLHVASHLTTRHAGLRLLWLRDVREITVMHRDTLDWNYVYDTARQLHLSTPVAAGLAASARWLGAPIPQAQIARLRHAFGRHALWPMIERRMFDAEIAALRAADLAKAAPPVAWRSLAVSVGWFLVGRAPWRAFMRIVAPSRAYMAWWYTGPVASRKQYCYAVGYRIAYVALSALSALAVRLRAQATARYTARLVRRLQTRTRYPMPSSPADVS